MTTAKRRALVERVYLNQLFRQLSVRHLEALVGAMEQFIDNQPEEPAPGSASAADMKVMRLMFGVAARALAEKLGQ